MQTVSNNYKEYLNNITSISPKNKIVIEGVEYSGTIIKTYPKISHSNTTFIGGFPAKTVSFEIYNFDNNIDVIGKEITVYKGITINGEIEWVKQGIFIPQSKDVTTNISTKTITVSNAQDRTQLFDNKYESLLDWSNGQKHTGLEIVQEICTKRNVMLETTNFAWSNYQFKQPNFAEDITDREVISRIAEIGGEIGIISNNGGLAIKGQNITGDTIQRRRYEKLSKEQAYTINTIVLGMQGTDNDIVYPETTSVDRIEFRIEDNPFVDLYREEMISTVAGYVLGKSYIPFSVEGFVDGFIYELNDVLTIIDKNGDSFSTVILNYSNSSRIKSIIQAETMDKTSSNYIIAGSTKESMKKVKLEVNHINQTITSMAEEIDDYSERLTQTEQTVESISQKVSDIENLEREINNKNYIYIPDAMQGQLEYLEINGPFSLLFPSDNLYPSNDLYPLDSYLIIDKTKELSNDAVKVHLPLNYLEEGDKFIVENSKTRIVKFDGSIEELEDVDIQLFEGQNYIYLESFQNDNIELCAKYIIKNDYTDKLVTKVEMNSAINQTAKEINLSVSKKVNSEEIISTINQSAEEIKILADKINLAGKKINLTSDNINIESNNFSVDSEGNMSCKNGTFTGDIVGSTFTGGQIHLSRNYSETNSELGMFYIDSVLTDGSLYAQTFLTGDILKMLSKTGSGQINATVWEDSAFLSVTGEVNCVTLTQTSLASVKKNFEKLENALKIIKDVDIYKYNFKFEVDEDKKHIGFVIGDGFNYSKEITSKNNDGADIYSMASVCIKAIQEQQEEIEKQAETIEHLFNKIKELEELIKNA